MQKHSFKGHSRAMLAAVAAIWTGTATAPAFADKRFPQLTLEQLSPEQRPLGEEILKISSVGLAGPYNPMLRSPVMAERLFRLLEYLRFKTSVPRRLNEFAILIQARLWTSQVEWYAHHPPALKAGLSESVAAELKEGKRPSAMKPDEAVVYDFCTELSTTHKVSDATFQRAKEMLGEQHGDGDVGPAERDEIDDLRAAGRRSHRAQRDLRHRRHAAERGGGRRPAGKEASARAALQPLKATAGTT
jgi:4-carboxymuconolactone decarboxylase